MVHVSRYLYCTLKKIENPFRYSRVAGWIFFSILKERNSWNFSLKGYINFLSQYGMRYSAETWYTYWGTVTVCWEKFRINFDTPEQPGNFFLNFERAKSMEFFIKRIYQFFISMRYKIFSWNLVYVCSYRRCVTKKFRIYYVTCEYSRELFS